MLGMIPKVLVDLICTIADREQLDKVYKHAGIDKNRVYSINEPYSDKEWQNFFKSSCHVLSLTEQQAYTVYADAFIGYASHLFPTWFTMAKNSREFLLLQPIIHNSFATGVQDKESRKKIEDKFRVEEEDENSRLTVHYKSPNKHCGLYIALAYRTAQYYSDEIIINKTHCQLNGDEECVMCIDWVTIESN